jgi:hypothetical protein
MWIGQLFVALFADREGGKDVARARRNKAATQ